MPPGGYFFGSSLQRPSLNLSQTFWNLRISQTTNMDFTAYGNVQMVDLVVAESFSAPGRKGLMPRINFLLAALLAGGSALVLAPSAHADDPVVYEVWSAAVGSANVEWSDTAGHHSLQNVPLPWRTSVMVSQARSDDAQLRATWQPGSDAPVNPGRYFWVRLRIYTSGSQICEHIADVGHGECTGRGYYADVKSPG
jgi:hypothetical protein